MKIKRMVSALALAAGLAISVPSLASTFGLSSQTMTSVQAADGWQRDDGGVFYLQNEHAGDRPEGYRWRDLLL